MISAALLSPLARIAFAVLVILGVGASLYAKGRVDGRSGCEARVAAAVVKEQLRQDGVRQQVVAQAAAREEQVRADLTEAEQKVADYERELASRATQPAPAGTCAPDFRLRPADVERLRKFQ